MVMDDNVRYQNAKRLFEMGRPDAAKELVIAYNERRFDDANAAYTAAIGETEMAGGYRRSKAHRRSKRQTKSQKKSRRHSRKN